MARIEWYINETSARKDVRKLVKKASRLLRGTGCDFSVIREEDLKMKISLSKESSRKAFWHTFRILSFVFTKDGRRTSEDIDFEDIFTGFAVYNCGCEVLGFSSHFEGKWSYGYAMQLVMDSMSEIYNNGGKISFKIDLRHFTVSMNIVHGEMCDDCAKMPQRVAWLKEVMRPDNLLQGSIYSHGLATGFGVNEVSSEVAEENLKKLLQLSEDKEICCSWKTQQIGGFGLFVRGEVTIASNRDLWSYVGYTGSRDFNVDEMEEYLIDRKEDLDFTVWDHTEFFVRPKKVIAFWAKHWFVRDIPGGKEFVEKLRKEGYKVYITKSRHR